MIDVSLKPFRVVAVFRDNRSAGHLCKNHAQCGTAIQAFILVEENNIGSQVTDVLVQGLEYENIFHCQERQQDLTLKWI